MVAKVTFLFLFGIAISSGELFSKLKLPLYRNRESAPSLQYNGCPSAPELAPFICKLIQQNVQLYYKPKLVTPSTYIPPLVVEKCETPESGAEIPAPGPEMEPLVIPQAPELPPMASPSLSFPVFYEKPAATVSEPCEPSSFPEMPAVNVPVAPNLSLPEILSLPQVLEIVPESDKKHIEDKPMFIPQPPELPAFVMPEIPVQVLLPEPSVTTAPCPEDESALVISPPEAPELPPVSLPELPVQVVIPSEPLTAPEFDYNSISYLTHIPQPPELPAFVMPEIPVQVVIPEQSVAPAPCPEDQPATVISPPAPELHTENFPEFPDFAEIPSGPEATPEVDYNSVSYLPAEIPQPPELSAFVMPEIPVQVVVQEPSVAAAPCSEDQLAPITSSPAPIPEALEVLPGNLPEFSHIEISSAPAVTPEIDYNLVNYLTAEIPQPPEFPAFVVSQLPVELVVQEPAVVTAPCPEDQPASVVAIPEYIQSPIAIPAAPELPPAVLPEFPSRPVSLPTDIALPSMIIEQPLPEPCPPKEVAPEIDYNTFSYLPAEIPQPPELSVFVMPELPPIELLVEEPPAPKPAAPELSLTPLPDFPVQTGLPENPFEKPKEPWLTGEVVISQLQLLTIPEPPKLPELIMPELPLNLPIAKPTVPCESPAKSSIEIGVMRNPYYERYFPSQISINNEKLKEIFIPNQPVDPNFFPLRCVYNLVKEYVIPNIASDRYRSLENVEILPASFIPCN